MSVAPPTCPPVVNHDNHETKPIRLAPRRQVRRPDRPRRQAALRRRERRDLELRHVPRGDRGVPARRAAPQVRRAASARARRRNALALALPRRARARTEPCCSRRRSSEPEHKRRWLFEPHRTCLNAASRRRSERYGDERDPAMRAHLTAISPTTRAHRIQRPVLIVQVGTRVCAVSWRRGRVATPEVAAAAHLRWRVSRQERCEEQRLSFRRRGGSPSLTRAPPPPFPAPASRRRGAGASPFTHEERTYLLI